MQMIRKLLFVLISLGWLILHPCEASGQDRPGTMSLSGMVTDSLTGQPLNYITVSLRLGGNPVKVAVSGSDGSFKLPGLKAGRYELVFTAVSFRTKLMQVDLSDSTKTTLNLGAVYLQEQVNGLREVVIKGSKPIIKQEIDRISYELSADPDSKGNNLMAMIRKVPLLSIDGSGNILLKGKDDFRVFINGKPSSIFDNNLKEALRSMPASSIQRIEVITNPSAKYDAEGLAGIINIVTVKKVEGYKGSINLSGQYPVEGASMGGSLAVKQGKFGISAFGGAGLSPSVQVQSSTSRVSTDTSGTALSQNAVKKSNGHSGYFGTEMSYEVTPLNLIAAQINVNTNQTKSDIDQLSVLNGPTGRLQAYDSYNVSKTTGQGWDAAINYQLGFKSNKNELLTFSYRYSAYRTDLSSRQYISNRVNYDLQDFTQTDQGKAKEQTIQVDYIYPARHLTVEAGLKGILRKNTSDYLYSTLDQDGLFETDPSLSNAFTNDQNIFGAYNTYQFSLKKFDIKAGFRLEQTFTRADFTSSDSKISRDYLNIIPTISIEHKIDEFNSLNLAFSQRIKRPGINKLNPFIDRTNPSIESSGNPDLRAALINDLQLSYSIIRKTTINIGFDYSFVRNLFMRVARLDPVTQITRISYENTGKIDGVGMNIYVNSPLSDALNLTLNGNGSFNRLQGMDGDSPVEVNIFTYNLSATASYGLDRGWRINANVNAVSRNVTSLQGRINGVISSSFGVNKELIKNKLSFAAAINNPFAKYRYNKLSLTGVNFLQTNISRDYFRSYSLSLNYNFGGLKDNIKKNKRRIKNDDLSN